MAAHQAPLSLGFSRQEHWSGLPFPSPRHESEKWKQSRSVMSDSSWPHGLQPTRLLRPWNFPGRSAGLGCHCLLQNLFLQPHKFLFPSLSYTKYRCHMYCSIPCFFHISVYPENRVISVFGDFTYHFCGRVYFIVCTNHGLLTHSSLAEHRLFTNTSCYSQPATYGILYSHIFIDGSQFYSVKLLLDCCLELQLYRKLRS